MTFDPTFDPRAQEQPREKFRPHQPGDLAAFLRLLAPHPAQWIGTIERKHGLFFTPHPAPSAPSGNNPFAHAHLPTGFWPRAPFAKEVFDCLYVDMDAGTLEGQRSALSILPEPTALIETGDRRYGEGGRGMHAFWKLAVPIFAADWARLQLMLVGLLGSDPCTLSPFQPMRVGGFGFPGRYQTLVKNLREVPVSLNEFTAGTRELNQLNLLGIEAGRTALNKQPADSSRQGESIAGEINALVASTSTLP